MFLAFTPLMYAANNKNWRVVRLLINAGAYVNVRTLDCWTALMYAAGKNNAEAVDILIEAGAVFTKNDLKALTSEYKNFEKRKICAVLREVWGVMACRLIFRYFSRKHCAKS